MQSLFLEVGVKPEENIRTYLNIVVIFTVLTNPDSKLIPDLELLGRGGGMTTM